VTKISDFIKKYFPPFVKMYKKKTGQIALFQTVDKVAKPCRVIKYAPSLE